MSAVDIIRSFAESRSGDHEVIRDGITYGTARELLAALEHTAAEEREACAKVCMDLKSAARAAGDAVYGNAYLTAERAIRARGSK